MPEVLVAGIGNASLGDDAFGVEVARRMGSRPIRQEIRVVDFGLRVFDLAFALQQARTATILVGALANGGRPGDLYLIEPQPSSGDGMAVVQAPAPEEHRVDPATVIRLTEALGTVASRLVVVGCEPERTAPGRAGEPPLSGTIELAVPGAIELVVEVAGRLLDEPAAPLPVSPRDR